MSKVVCVTGMTGFLASHIVKQLLERDYIVHGIVRNLSQKEKYLFLQNFENINKNLKSIKRGIL